MEILTKHTARNPNQMVHSMYWGVTRGGLAVKVTKAVSEDQNHIVTTREYSRDAVPGRGQSGNIGILILGGMETTLDEVEDILAARREKKFVQRRSNSEIVQMCRYVQERRNDRIKHLRKNPSERPVVKKKNILFLPKGVKFVNTSEPGLQLAVRG